MGRLWHGKGHFDRHIQSLRARLEDARTDLDALVASAGNLEHFLETTVEEFDRAAETIPVETVSLHLDAMNVETGPGPRSRERGLVQFRVGRCRPRIVQLVKFVPGFVRVDAGLAGGQAERALGVR